MTFQERLRRFMHLMCFEFSGWRFHVLSIQLQAPYSYTLFYFLALRSCKLTQLVLYFLFVLSHKCSALVYNFYCTDYCTTLFWYRHLDNIILDDLVLQYGTVTVSALCIYIYMCVCVCCYITFRC